MNIKNFVTYWLNGKKEVIGCVDEKDAKEWKKVMEKDGFNAQIVE